MTICYFLLLSIFYRLSIFMSKFVQVDPPFTQVNSGNVFNEDATAIAVLTTCMQK